MCCHTVLASQKPKTAPVLADDLALRAFLPPYFIKRVILLKPFMIFNYFHLFKNNLLPVLNGYFVNRNFNFTMFLQFFQSPFCPIKVIIKLQIFQRKMGFLKKHFNMRKQALNKPLNINYTDAGSRLRKEDERLFDSKTLV